MKERFILFSGPMVRAILEGRKTQTRRVVKPQPHDTYEIECGIYHPMVIDRNGDEDAGPPIFGAYSMDGEWGVKCPYGQPGDRLWVRETWQYCDWTEDGEPYIGYAADDSRLLMRGIPDEWHERNGEIWEQLSAPENYNIDGRAADRRWRPSIHMPRWASRITLEIVSVRVERLQDIDEDGAMAEGAEPLLVDPDGGSWPHYEGFRDLWESINGAGSWEANPWVWVVEFKRVLP